MVKTPKTRHSKSRREPVTIDLGPDEVSRVEAGQANTPNREAAAEQAAHASQPAPEATVLAEEPMRAEEAGFEAWEKEEAAAASAAHAAETGGTEPDGAYEAGSAAERNGGTNAGAQPTVGGEALAEEDRAGESAEGETRIADADADEASEGSTRPSTSGSAFGRAATSGYGFDAGSPRADDASDFSDPAEGTATLSAPHQRRGLNGIAAGIIGGVIALLGAGALQYAGVLGAPGAGASLDAVNSEIASLKTRLAALGDDNGGDTIARVNGLSDALDRVRADVEALKSASTDNSGNADLAALSDRVGKVEQSVAPLGQNGNQQPVDLGPVKEQLSALDALVKSTGETATKQEGRLAALEQSVAQLSAKVDAQASQPKIALSIAASALKAALERGGAFSAELETLAAIAPDAPEIASLRSYAEKGVPTRAEITEQADAAADAMIAAAERSDEDAGFLQNLLSSAESLVKVRPVVAVEGPGVPETVARLELAVKQGEYAKALSEYDTLPEPVKAAGADFAGKMKARLEVEKQVDALIASAMKA